MFSRRAESSAAWRAKSSAAGEATDVGHQVGGPEAHSGGVGVVVVIPSEGERDGEALEGFSDASGVGEGRGCGHLGGGLGARVLALAEELIGTVDGFEAFLRLPTLEAGRAEL